MIGLYSGRDIVARKANGEMLTRTQTAASAYNAITRKYGDISASAKYFHKGKGNWVRYSITNDRKRTGKTTNDIKKWRAAPHKLDYEGKDTADTRSRGKSLSTAALTTSCEMVRRSGSRKIPTNKYRGVHGKLKFGKFVGRYRDIAYTYHPEQNTLSFKWDTGGKRMAIPPQFKTLRDVEVNNRLMTKHEVVEFAKKSIDIVIRGVDNVFYKTNRNLSNDEVARATKTGKHKGKAADKKDAKRVDRDKLSVAERAPNVKASTGTKPATFDLKNNPNRKEFVSDYTGITDHLQRRAKRVAKIRTDQDKGRYKNADTRRREASHAKYVKRAEKIRTSYPKKL